MLHRSSLNQPPGYELERKAMFPIDQVALAALVRTEPFRIDDILPDLPMLSRDQVVRAPSRLSKRSAVRNLGRGLYSRGDAIEVEYCLNQAREAKTAEETHSLEMRGPIRALIRSAVADALEPLRGYVESAGDKIPSDVRKELLRRIDRIPVDME